MRDTNKRFGTRKEHQKRVSQLAGFVEIMISKKVHHFDILVIFFVSNFLEAGIQQELGKKRHFSEIYVTKKMKKSIFCVFPDVYQL